MTDLLESFLRYCSMKKAHNDRSLLTVDDDFLTSTQICLLKQYILKNNIEFNTINIPNLEVRSYLENIFTREIENRASDSYIPLTTLPLNHDEFIKGKGLGAIYNILKKEFQDPSALFTIFSELIDNIYDHSEFSNAFIMAQKYDPLGVIDLTFLDDGITIPGAFRKSKVDITSHDSDCIKQAWNGKTTRNIEGRGKGIRSSYNICTKIFQVSS